MIVSLVPLLDILEEPGTRYLVPIFQRVYSWDRLQCDQLWADVLRALDQGKTHFSGTIISRPEADDGGDALMREQGFRRVSLIDGQQRLTTVMLMLIALRDRWREEGAATQAAQVDKKYLHVAPGIFKLRSSEADMPTLAHLIDGVGLPAADESSQLLLENHLHFKEKLETSSIDGEAMLEGLHALRVVLVELEEEDRPQQVFESLNAKGRPLSTADLLRNVLLVRYGQEEQERLFDIYWSPIDDAFRRFGVEQDIYLDAALHSWLSKNAPGANAAKRSDLYQAFKIYIAQNASIALEELLMSVNAECMAFAANPDAPEAREHLDWVTDKPKGLISQRKLFGD